MVFGLRLLVGTAVAASLSGCASGGALTLADRFVRPGTPSVDLGGPRPLASRGDKKPPSSMEGTAIAHVPNRLSSSISGVEATDPELRDAMFRLRLAPTVEHHLQVARAYRRLGIKDAAYDYLSRSLTVNGPDPTVHDALARLWRDWGQPGQGLSHAHRAVYMAPRWPVAQNTLGTLLYRLGHRADARKRFEAAVLLDPKADYALQNLCALALADGRTREAISLCRQAEAARRGRPSRASSSESR